MAQFLTLTGETERRGIRRVEDPFDDGFEGHAGDELSARAGLGSPQEDHHGEPEGSDYGGHEVPDHGIRLRGEEGQAESAAGRGWDGEDLPLGEPPGVDAWVGGLECGDGDPVLPGDA